MPTILVKQFKIRDNYTTMLLEIQVKHTRRGVYCGQVMCTATGVIVHCLHISGTRTLTHARTHTSCNVKVVGMLLKP